MAESVGQVWQLCWLTSVLQFRLGFIASLPNSSQGVQKIAIGLTALASLNSKPLWPAGKRSTVGGKHDDDRGRGIAEGAQ